MLMMRQTLRIHLVVKLRCNEFLNSSYYICVKKRALNRSFYKHVFPRKIRKTNDNLQLYRLNVLDSKASHSQSGQSIRFSYWAPMGKEIHLKLRI